MMASRLPGILDHLVILLEGTADSVDRSVPKKRFRHSKAPIELSLQAAARAPYPFNLDDFGWSSPFDEEANVAGVEVWRAIAFSIRIGYADKPHEQLEMQKKFAEDSYVIHRCLSDPDSWLAATGFSKVSVSQATPAPVPIPGSETNELIQALSVPCVLTYTEDYS